MRKLMVLLGAGALVLVLAMPAVAATSVKWKSGTNRTVTVKKGSVVKFIWADKLPHNVVGGGVVSPTKRGRGKTWSHRYSSSTTVFCALHSNMVVRIKVRR